MNNVKNNQEIGRYLEKKYPRILSQEESFVLRFLKFNLMQNQVKNKLQIIAIKYLK